MDVNIPREPDTPDRPIGAAVRAGETDTVRWLIEHGSDINYGWGGEPPFCHPLPSAIRDNRLDIVRLLVEAGADLSAKDRNHMTPLDWADGMRLTEIVDYLRSKRARLSRELPGYVPPPPPAEKPIVVKYAETVLGPTNPVPFAPVLPETVPVVVHGYWGDGTSYLFTQGMSDRPMAALPGGERYRHAELVLGFEDWPEDGNWMRDEIRWLLQWVRRVAQTPFENDTWLGGRYGVVSNGEPPEPLSAFTRMTCWLLLAERGPLTRLELADGRSVVFYTMLPIHTAERDFLARAGIVPLLEKFEAADITPWIEPDRPSVV